VCVVGQENAIYSVRVRSFLAPAPCSIKKARLSILKGNRLLRFRSFVNFLKPAWSNSIKRQNSLFKGWVWRK
jgi:hypothetical protein